MKLITTALLVALLTLVGCGGGADTEITVAEAQEASSAMSVDDLKGTVAEYESAIKAKMDEMAPLKDKLTAIPLTEQMGDEAKALQADIAKVTEDMAALKERLAVYMAALKEKGAAAKEVIN